MKFPIRLFLLTAIWLLLTVGAYAEAPRPPYVPQETRVALLPVVDTTGDKTPNVEVVSSARVSLGRQFVGHGFKVVPAPAVTAALDSLKVTLTPQAPPSPEALTKIGAAVNARLVVFVVVTPTGVKIWVRDTKTQTFVVDGKVGNAGAARAAVEVALAEFFKPYDAYDC